MEGIMGGSFWRIKIFCIGKMSDDNEGVKKGKKDGEF